MVKMFAKTMIKDSTIVKARNTTEAVSDITPFLSLLLLFYLCMNNRTNKFMVHSVIVFPQHVYFGKKLPMAIVNTSRMTNASTFLTVLVGSNLYNFFEVGGCE